MIHAYQLNGYNIVLDAGSASVHAVDEMAFDAIRLEKIHDADNQAYFHTLGRIVTSLPGKTARVAKKHIGRIGRGDA